MLLGRCWFYSIIVLVLVLTGVVQATSTCTTICTRTENSTAPRNTTVPEGELSGIFTCQYPGESALALDWLVNGSSSIDDEAIETRDDHNSIGAIVYVKIAAVARLNGSIMECFVSFINGSTCCLEPAYFYVEGPPGPIDNVTLKSSQTNMLLLWKQPVSSTPFPISLCIEVHCDTTIDRSQSQCGVPVNQSYYSITVTNPDPEVLYRIVLTPMYMYDVPGAKNGTSSNVTGFFVGEPLSLPQDSVAVLVNVFNKRVSLDIVLSNADKLITTGYKVDIFFVKVVLAKNETCPLQRVSADISNSTITLRPDCPNLPREALGTVMVTAVNKAGNVTLSSPFNSHYVRNIKVLQCNDSPRQQCQLEVLYDFTLGVDSQIARGALAVFRGKDNDIQCFVGVGGDDILVGGLKADQSYNLSVFTVGSDGLPSTDPANLPIETNVTSDGVFPRRTHIKDVKVQFHSDKVCVKCHFKPDSPASHCVPLFFTLNESILQQIQILSGKLERHDDRAEGCLKVEKDSSFILVIFGYNNGTIEGRPLNYGRIIYDPKGGPLTAAIVMVIIIMILLATVLAVLTVSLLVWKYKCGKNTSVDIEAERRELRLSPLPAPKANKPDAEKQTESDSGRFTLTTSSDVDPQDLPVQTNEDGTKDNFKYASQCEDQTSGRRVVRDESTEYDEEGKSERSLKRKDTGGVDDRKGYLNNLCKTLQWKNEQTLKEDNHNQEYANENAHSHTDDDVADPAVVGNTSTIGLFTNEFEYHQRT